MSFRVLVVLLTLVASSAEAQTVHYLHTDGLGNIVAVTDEHRNVIERRVYEPYGLPKTPIADGPGFTGHDMDGETGLVYMQQRYYDPVIGRFLSVDPVGVGPTNGTNFNRHHYAANNPYKFIDPDGRLIRDRDCSLVIDCHGGGDRRMPDRMEELCRRVCLGAASDGEKDESGAAQGPTIAGTAAAPAVSSGVGAAIGIPAGVRAALSALTRILPLVSALSLSRSSQEYFLHYTNEEGHVGIEMDGFIDVSEDGNVYMTHDQYGSDNEAQSSLALKSTPTGYYAVPAQNVRVSSSGQVEPKYGQPGGGSQVTAPHPVPIEGARWVSIKP